MKNRVLLALLSLPTRLALWAGVAFFKKIQQPRLHPAAPDWAGCEALTAVSQGGVRIRGWWQPVSRKKGTILLIHGITINSFHYLNQARYLHAETGLAVAACDLRFHGLSDDGPLTFGRAESWDVRAFLGALENAGATHPFILIGDSLGALAAQRAIVEDDRVDGAALLQSPGWSWNAIGKSAKNLSFLARFLNLQYGFDILGDGDLRNLSASSMHRPPVFFINGDQDFYDWRAAQTIYDWWGTPNPGILNESPLSAPERNRWFVLVEGAEHDTGLPDCYNVWRWPLIWPNLVRFVEIIGERHL